MTTKTASTQIKEEKFISDEVQSKLLELVVGVAGIEPASDEISSPPPLEAKMRYRAYDAKVKYLISKNKDPYLFPELAIPVSTAKAWIKNQFHLKYKESSNLKSSISDEQLRLNCEVLQRENRDLKRQMRTTKEVYKLMGIDPSKKNVSDFYTRKMIVETLQKNKGKAGLYKTLQDMGFSISRYKRWRKEIEHKKNLMTKPEEYFQNHPRALTEKEFRTLERLYTEPQLFHFPLHALVTYARKTNQLHSAPSTWRKYVKMFNLKRPRTFTPNKYKYPVGIQREHPDMLWHIDVSEIQVLSKKKYYLQVLIDNYSKYVVGWQLLQMYSGVDSINLVENSIRNYSRPLAILSDAGTENLNRYFTPYLEKEDIKQLVAKLNIPFSNSRVEVFFRMLKSNYLSKLRISSRKVLFKNIERYVDDYNQRIPHSSLDYRTPEEAYFGMPSDFYPQNLKDRAYCSISMRMKEYWK